MAVPLVREVAVKVWLHKSTEYMRLVILFYFCFSVQIGFTQNDISSVLDTYNDHSIPYISVEQLKENFLDVVLIDTRSSEEYKVSHIKGALF